MLTHCRLETSSEIAGGLAEEVIRTFGEVRLRVYGTSMVPSILPGDFISVRRAGIQDISAGEIVLFFRDARFFVHRVVRERSFSGRNSPAADSLITRGDRLLYDDPAVTADQLLGRVVLIERNNRQVPLMARGTNHPIVRVLQSSDRATSIYLWLAARRRTLLPGRTTCQA
jgi:signal peptidase I